MKALSVNFEDSKPSKNRHLDFAFPVQKYPRKELKVKK
jgi:hypothetical protein